MGTGNSTVTIKLDIERPIRFDFAALCRLEDFGVDLSSLGDVATGRKKAPVKLIAQMLAAGLTAEGYEPSAEEIIRLIDKMPGNLTEKSARITAAVMGAFALAMPEAAEGNVEGTPAESSTGEKPGGSGSASSD